MEKLIPLISDLQEIIRKSDASLEISLPMIAVIGSQSTGKSSLLEAIIGREFLPKGKGVVTRRPIEIQLCQTEKESQYAEFVDNKGQKYHNLEEFKKAIDQQTEKVCGSNKNISSAPLRIRFYSQKVLNLLLVDLPGIVKNPIGDQPKDIEQQVLKMVRGYIKNPNCIIVAVSKASEDSANSESLKLAREVDKEGIRTIGVLTQVDLIDPSHNPLKQYNILSNKVELGHTCVYLRPSKSSLSIEQQFEEEEKFFRQHEQYKKISSEKLGVKSLTKTMNMVLAKHIKQELPVIRENIVYLYELKRERIMEFGNYEKVTDPKVQGMLVLSLLSKYTRYFVELIEGKSIENRSSLIGGARIEYIFFQTFVKSINKMNPFEYLTDADIRTAIRNANGLRKSLFLPESAFENLLKVQISRLKQPALECAHLIHEQLRRSIYEIKIAEIERYQVFSSSIFKVMEDLLSKSLAKTEEMIRNLIEIELGFVNTHHPDFIDVISLVKNKNEANGMSSDHMDMSFETEHRQSEESEEVKKSLFSFHKKKESFPTQSNNSEIIDAKLSKIKLNTETEQKERKSESAEFEQYYSSITENSYLPRYRLPCVPQEIKVNENPKPREQTETEMIKRLIVSYFNVVKKNINDSVPKTIVTFLVNHCRNSCEKILVSNLYKEEKYESLLHEEEAVIGEREKLQKEIGVLKECLDSINSLDSQLML